MQYEFMPALLKYRALVSSSDIIPHAYAIEIINDETLTMLLSRRTMMAGM